MDQCMDGSVWLVDRDHQSAQVPALLGGSHACNALYAVL